MTTARKVLLIEDDLDDQYLFCDALSKIHPAIIYKVANNGVEALSILEESPLYDIIFMDLNMPKMDGFECLKHLKTKENLKNIPVVIISTSNRKEDIEKCKSLGAAIYFSKPSAYNELFDRLQHILSEGVSYY